jgi:hypothetical protein
MKNLDRYDYFIHYEPYTKIWYGFHRDDIVNYRNGWGTKHKLYKSKCLLFLYFKMLCT